LVRVLWSTVFSIVAPRGRHRAGTHLIPPPEGPGDAEAFVQYPREGGYEGRVTAGEDLTTLTL